VEGNLLVLLLLGGAFGLVGVHLVLYSRRQSRLVRRFAESRSYRYSERDDGRLERELSGGFELRESACRRAFSRIRDVVFLDCGELFRAVELLDLSPHGTTENSHRARTAVRFPAGSAPAGIFHVAPDLEVHQRYPRNDRSCAGDVAGLLRRAGIGCPPHPLSLTLVRGQGVAYLEPLVTGSLKEDHLSYLADLASRLSSTPAGDREA
jgi:hypothetical protein